MDYLTKQKEINEQFDAIKKELEALQQAQAEKQAELLRLQGEFRILGEIQKEEELKKDKK